MTVPTLKLFTHVAPQLIPDGLLVMLPWPAPKAPIVRVTVSVWFVVAKLAVTFFDGLHRHDAGPGPRAPAAAPAGAALVKDELGPGVAVSVTTVFCAKNEEQVAPHEIPEGLLVTVPVPVPPPTW